MSNEVQVRAFIRVRADNVTYDSPQTAFNADMAGRSAATPGSFTATVAGTDVDLSKLAQPGWCYVKNLDTVNFVTIGVHDPGFGLFLPMLELKPGEGYTVRLSRKLGLAVGTGSSHGNALRVVADTAPCRVQVDAFEA